MADNSYQVEIRQASSNGYFTPDQARAYYGRYSRAEYCVHWWGGGEQEDSHDSIVNYMLRQAELGNKSCNYVLSDAKISLLVGPDYVAWCQESGNAVGISVETEPGLSDEGYKKHGWLHHQLCQRYGHWLEIVPHNKYTNTACPGGLDLPRIGRESRKWANGEYDTVAPAPAPAPVQRPEEINVMPIPEVRRYTQPNARLVDIRTLTPIREFPEGTPMEIAGEATFGGKTFQLTKYATQHKTGNGFLIGDLKDAPAPLPSHQPASDPTAPPTPGVPSSPGANPGLPQPGAVVEPDPEPTPTQPVSSPDDLIIEELDNAETPWYLSEDAGFVHPREDTSAPNPGSIPTLPFPVPAPTPVKNAKLEALKEIGRLLLFALPGVFIQIFTDNPDLALGFGVPALALLRYLDKYLHESSDFDSKGLAPF